MSKKITNTVYLHKKAFQVKLAGIQINPNRDYLVQTLLGIPPEKLQGIYSNHPNKTKQYTLSAKRVNIQQRRLGTAKKENSILDNSLKNIIDTDSLIELRDKYQSNIEFTHSNFSSVWTMDSPAPKHGEISNFSLVNWQELDPIKDKILEDSFEDGYLSLVFLFPSKPEESEAKDGHELKWHFFEGTLNETNLHTDAYALIVALQLMNLGDINDKTCTELVSSTLLNTTFSIDESLQNNIAIKDPKHFNYTGGGEIIRATAGGHITKYRKKLLGKKTIAGKNQELESLKYGLSFLLTQTPGILCKLKIPINTEAFSTVNGDLSTKSSLWLFGPKYWIEFIEATTSNKEGSLDSKDAREIENKHVYTIQCEIKPRNMDDYV